MDVDKMIAAAMQEWHDMTDVDVPDVDDAPTARAEVPVGVEPPTGSEPHPEHRDAELETESITTGGLDPLSEAEWLDPLSEPSLPEPEGAADPADTLQEMQELERHPEDQLPADEYKEEFPDEPSVELVDPEPRHEPSLLVEEHDVQEDAVPNMDYIPYRDHSVSAGSRQGVNITLSDGWQSNISDTVHQQIKTLEGVMHAQLEDEMTRSIGQFDMLGGD